MSAKKEFWLNFCTIVLPLLILFFQQLDARLPKANFQIKAPSPETEKALTVFFMESKPDYLRLTGESLDFRLGRSPAFPGNCFELQASRGKISIQTSYCTTPPPETAGAIRAKLEEIMRES